MYQLLYVITATLSLLISGILLLMLVRAIMSWLPVDEDSTLLRFVYMCTEPVIMPVRALFDHFGWFEGMPIDMAFFVTSLILFLISTFL